MDARPVVIAISIDQIVKDTLRVGVEPKILGQLDARLAAVRAPLIDRLIPVATRKTRKRSIGKYIPPVAQLLRERGAVAVTARLCIRAL